jgi:hypothetical protein
VRRFLAPYIRVSNHFRHVAELPRGRTLDGELYIGRNRFDETSGIVRSLHSPRWDELKYMVSVHKLFLSPFLLSY